MENIKNNIAKNPIFYMVPFMLLFMILTEYCLFYDFDKSPVLEIFINYYNIIISVLIIYSYYRSSLTNNITFIRKYVEKSTESEYSNNKVICYKCDNKIKPERTHHCSICKNCLIKMDHHCPFMGNCISQKNHKLYILFLFYCFLLLLPYTYCYFKTVANNYQKIKLIKSTQIKLLNVVFYFVFFFLIVGCYAPTVSLLSQHIPYIYNNATTLEDLKNDLNVYNMGYYYNIKKFMGNFFIFLLPIVPVNKYEGYYFPKIKKSKYKNCEYIQSDKEDIDIDKIIEEKMEEYDNIKFIYN